MIVHPKTSRRRRQNLCADKGYAGRPAAQAMQQCGYTPHDRLLSILTDTSTSLGIMREGNPTTTSPNYLTCGPGAGHSVVYALATSGNGYNLTNITVYGGWSDGNRDQQAYTISYSTVAQPTVFMPLTVVNYNPVNPIGLSLVRTELIPAMGSLATNVSAVMFDFTTPYPEYGYCGVAKITMNGFVSVNSDQKPVITQTNEQNMAPDWVVTPNLIAGQLPSSSAGSDTLAGGSFTNLTDGLVNVNGTNVASCGDQGGACTSLTYTCTNGSWNITNIAVYTGWPDYGRAGQFYNVSYSTLSAPATFLPLTSVYYDPSFNNTNTWATRVDIAPPLGQALLVTNVAAIHFDFTPQGSQDFGWSGYTEIVLQGTNLPSAMVIPPVMGKSMVSGDHLIVTGTGGTPNSSYTWLTTTNLAAPIIWTTNSTGTLDGTGSFSNSIPIGTIPASYFRMRLP